MGRSAQRAIRISQRAAGICPEFGAAEETRQLYTETIGALFSEYHATAEGMFVFLHEKTPRPEEMKPEAFDRTLKARAFDVARYLLPLATNTSLGQIVNARTLEGQVSRLLSHPAAEIRELGRRLKDAAAGEAWNVQREPMAALQAEIAALDPTLAAKSEIAADSRSKDRADSREVRHAE